MANKNFSIKAVFGLPLIYPAFENGQTVIRLGVYGDRVFFAMLGFSEMPLQDSALDFQYEDLSSFANRQARASLKKQSLDYRAINESIDRDIRREYSLADELQALREDDADYKQFVSDVLSSYASQKEDLGF